TIRKLPKAVSRIGISTSERVGVSLVQVLTRSNRVAELRASTPILLVGLLVLFQCIAAGQNNSPHEAGPNPETTPVSWGSGPTHEFKGYGRELGCGVLLSDAFSRKALEMGRSYAQQLETTSKLINDPAITNYVNRIGEKLTSNLDVPIQLTLRIIAR